MRLQPRLAHGLGVAGKALGGPVGFRHVGEEGDNAPTPAREKPAREVAPGGAVVGENAVEGAEHVILPVSIPLGPADAPIGAAAIMVSGRYIDRILSEAENLSHGVEAQYFISKDGCIKMERINNGPQKPPTVTLEKGPYPDPWLIEWLKKDKDFDAVIRKDPDSKNTSVYCFAYVPAMEEWYVEKIRLQDFLNDIDSVLKGTMQ